MNFSGISEEGLVGTLLRFPLKFIPAQMRVPILQGRLRGRQWIVGSSVHGCWLGSYEFEKRRLFEQTIAPGGIVYDIGAHVGFYTLLAATLVGPGGCVLAFEPVPRNLFYLRRHLQINHVSNVQVIEAAVAEVSGMTTFDEGPSSSMGHLAAQGSLQVRTVCLDELVKDELPVPNYVKIDVEGAEMRVLTGAQSTLAEVRPMLFLATHGRDLHRQCCDLLRSLGYQLFPISGNSIEETDEILACGIP